MSKRRADIGELDSSSHRESNPHSPAEEAPTVGDTHKADAGRRDPSSDFRPGQVLASRYEIIQRLGHGGFGAVYRAHDRDLNRTVAIKRSIGLRSFVAGQIRNEALAIASLNHPNIVHIYDLISVSDDELLIVMECLEGVTLRARLLEDPLPIVEAVKIGIQIAEALGHAHERKLVHSDLKPANLVLTNDGTIKLLDFGLAVAYFPDEVSNRIGGTRGYMSPEQIRGESHRIDGRADIWSFGVVLYEMLTGGRPFVGANSQAVHEATLRKEVPPPRQLNPQVDEELQRITLRCLEKRMVDRYDSVSALRTDLKQWLVVQAGDSATALAPSVAGNAVTRDSSGSTATILRSRGLQPFTERDAETYLALIPGPRDRNGIPDSIWFWKRWVESDDPNTEYPVGVLYGPSGSGKTSYVRAGLLGRLGREICRVYVECRPGDLGGRVTQIIESQLHEDSTGSSLRELLNRLRRNDSTSRGFRKLLIVLDQFESWSQTAALEERRDFADALRQCDGSRIRALVITRDDYWMGVKELLRWIEIPLQEGRNLASVDLLDQQDAMRILEAIGRESGILPPNDQPLSNRQRKYIQQAVEELTIGGSVICVHLVMFAQMARFRDWNPRELRSGGGVSGACSLFFQELFQKSGGSSPEYRRIADAVPPIVAALMPPGDATVAEVRVSRDQLLAAVQASGQAHLFDDAMHVLNEDLRIVTVIAEDPLEVRSQRESTVPHYRLAHDFLVTPMNGWLDRVRRRTWRGRSKARLSELSNAWSLRPVRTHLPGFFEYLSLLVGSRFQTCTDTESKYIRAATRLHAGRISAAVVGVIAFLAMTGLAIHQRSVALDERDGRLTANVQQLYDIEASGITNQMATLREFGDDAARRIASRINSSDASTRLRSQLYLQTLSPQSIAGIAGLLEDAEPELFTAILDIARKATDSVSELTAVAQGTGSIKLRSRAAILLAYLGETTELESQLAGSDDANRDQAILLEAAGWNDVATPWVDLLNSHPDPQVRYHAGVVLGSYRREQLLAEQISFDYLNLINSADAAVHSVGRFLAKHMGEDPYRFPLNPPDSADWKIGPDNIPMVWIAPQDFEYERSRNDSNVFRTLQLDQGFWFATIPVSRRLFQEFVDQVDVLPNGAAQNSIEVENDNIPDELKRDATQPIMEVNIAQACTFCNWLSEREGLTACYRYRADLDMTMQEAMQASGPRDFVLPKIPWETIESANGYRLPTYDQYLYAIRSGYTKRGTPWAHVNKIGLIGGDYVSPRQEPHARALFTLIPNRMGMFVNDTECGSRITGHEEHTAVRPANVGVIPNRTVIRPINKFSIYLVQP